MVGDTLKLAIAIDVIGNFRQGFQQAGAGLSTLEKGMSALKGMGASLAAALPAMAISAVTDYLSKGMDMALDYEQSLNYIQRRAGLTGGQLENLRGSFEALRKTSAGSVFSLNDMATAFAGLAGGTETLDEDLEAFRQAMTLSNATSIGLSDSVRILDSTLDSWNMTANDAGRINDALVFAWQKTGEDGVDYLTDALNKNAGTFKNLGMGVEESLVTMGILGERMGGSSKKAITLFNAIAGLREKTKEMSPEIKKAVDRFYDFGASGKNVGEKLLNLRNIMGNADFDLLFGGEAGVATIAIEASSTLGTTMDSMDTTLTGMADNIAKIYENSKPAVLSANAAKLVDIQAKIAEKLLPAKIILAELELAGLEQISGDAQDKIKKETETRMAKMEIEEKSHPIYAPNMPEVYRYAPAQSGAEVLSSGGAIIHKGEIVAPARLNHNVDWGKYEQGGDTYHQESITIHQHISSIDTKDQSQIRMLADAISKYWVGG